MIGLLLTVTVHELGHLIFGLASGYRFLSLTVFGMTVLNINGKLRLTCRERFVYGQCLMYPLKEDADPKLLISGGVIMNLCAALAAGGVLVRRAAEWNGYRGMVLMLFLLESVILNVTGFAGNLFLGSKYSDGATLREVCSDHDNVLCYNNIMLVSRDHILGRTMDEIPADTYLRPARRTRSGLSDELMEMLNAGGDG